MHDKYMSSTWYYTVYRRGERLAPHIDGRKHEGDCHSIRTLLIYLNMPPDFDGGFTSIMEHEDAIHCIKPKIGKGLIMSQDVVHEGNEVTRGTKYVLRGDIMTRAICENLCADVV